jgi:anti-sigma28 factor (negative regulator of flagellin synthesis)
MTRILPPDSAKTHVLTNQAPQRQPEQASPRDTSSHSKPAPAGDKAEISTEAHELADLRQMVDAGRGAIGEMPEVRTELVAQARQRIDDGFYRSAEVQEKVAGRLAELFMEHPLF